MRDVIAPSRTIWYLHMLRLHSGWRVLVAWFVIAPELMLVGAAIVCTDPCPACGKCSAAWSCLSVSPGAHNIDHLDQGWEEGLYGSTEAVTHSYRIVFHDDVLDPGNCSCDQEPQLCSNYNKLFSVSRNSFDPAVSSCQFGWRTVPSRCNASVLPGTVEVVGYYTSGTYGDWRWVQMGAYKTNVEYVFNMTSAVTACDWQIYDAGSRRLLASVVQLVPNLSWPIFYRNALYYGGEGAALTRQTISYNTDLWCS